LRPRGGCLGEISANPVITAWVTLTIISAAPLAPIAIFLDLVSFIARTRVTWISGADSTIRANSIIAARIVFAIVDVYTIIGISSVVGASSQAFLFELRAAIFAARDSVAVLAAPSRLLADHLRGVRRQCTRCALRNTTGNWRTLLDILEGTLASTLNWEGESIGSVTYLAGHIDQVTIDVVIDCVGCVVNIWHVVTHAFHRFAHV
jgi:hypothetical protein